jgi:hypothetical protein
MQGYDLLLTPAMECTAFPLGRTAPVSTGGVELTGVDDDWCHFCYAFNLTGQPAISVPMGLVDGLPVGLQIVGRKWEDAQVLGAAAAWERSHPWGRSHLTVDGASVSGGVLEAVAAAVRRGVSLIEVPHRESLAAGMRLSTDAGDVSLRRVYSTGSDGFVVEFEPQGGSTRR